MEMLLPVDEVIPASPWQARQLSSCFRGCGVFGWALAPIESKKTETINNESDIFLAFKTSAATFVLPGTLVLLRPTPTSFPSRSRLWDSLHPPPALDDTRNSHW